MHSSPMSDKPKVSRLLSFKQLKPEKGIDASRMTIWRAMKAKRFPQSVVDETGHIRWHEHEIDEHIASLKRGSGRKPGAGASPWSKTISLVFLRFRWSQRKMIRGFHGTRRIMILAFAGNSTR